MAAAALRSVPPGLAAPALSAARAAPRLEPFAVFQRRESEPVKLLDGYREYGKGSWRWFWWPTAVLLRLHARTPFGPEARALVDGLRSARALPAPIDTFADAVEQVARERPELVSPIGRDDRDLGRPIFAVPLSESDIEAAAAAARRFAERVLAQLDAYGVVPSRSVFLDAGCGPGYVAQAVLGAGAAEVQGVDLDIHGPRSVGEIARISERLSPTPAAIQDADLALLPFPDGYFDVVFSNNVVEHLVELPTVLAELRRVLKPGGLAHHDFDPWFGRRGGHSLCTLDFPWGHVRVAYEEFDEYVSRHRPHEARDATDFWLAAFQRQRLTLDQTAELCRASGFEVLRSARLPLPLRDPHRAWYSSDVLADCRRLYPAVDPDDLLSVSASLTLRRR